MKKAFTLAEIMIVLTVIGILTAILLPMGFQNAPDENVMKFKKGYNTLASAIRELVTSDKYYSDGDLGIRPNSNLIDGTHDGDDTYFCESFADVISTKSVNCSQNAVCKNQYCWNHMGKVNNKQYCTMELLKQYADEACLDSEKTVGAEIVAADDIVYYQVSPKLTFGILHTSATELNSITENNSALAGGKAVRTALIKNDDGFVSTYKFICMDVDGINNGEDPFGFALRYDGRILGGKRADEWLNKSIQKNE